MKRIEVKLSLGVVAPLLDVIKTVEDSLDDELAAPIALDQVDDDLRTEWRDELIASQNGDVRNLLALFDSEFFASGVVNFDEDNADADTNNGAVLPPVQATLRSVIIDCGLATRIIKTQR